MQTFLREKTKMQGERKIFLVGSSLPPLSWDQFDGKVQTLHCVLCMNKVTCLSRVHSHHATLASRCFAKYWDSCHEFKKIPKKYKLVRSMKTRVKNPEIFLAFVVEQPTKPYTLDKSVA